MKLVGELDLLYLIGLFMALIYCFLLFKILAIREDYQYFSWRRKAANYLNKGNVLAKETRKIKLLRGKIKQQKQSKLFLNYVFFWGGCMFLFVLCLFLFCFCLFVFVFVCLFFETGFLCVVLAVLELTL